MHVQAKALGGKRTVGEKEFAHGLVLERGGQIQGGPVPGGLVQFHQRPNGARRPLDKGRLAGIAEAHRRVAFEADAIPLLVGHPIIKQQLNASRSQFHGSLGFAESS